MWIIWYQMIDLDEWLTNLICFKTINITFFLKLHAVQPVLKVTSIMQLPALGI